jgi:hypothetical protein
MNHSFTNKKLFTILFLATIIAIRFLVLITGGAGLYVFGIRINHFFIGLILVGIVYLISEKYSSIIIPVGLGLMADEFVFLLATDRQVTSYFSPVSIIGVIITSIIILSILFREK